MTHPTPMQQLGVKLMGYALAHPANIADTALRRLEKLEAEAQASAMKWVKRDGTGLPARTVAWVVTRDVTTRAVSQEEEPHLWDGTCWVAFDREGDAHKSGPFVFAHVIAYCLVNAPPAFDLNSMEQQDE